jgi:hypothetical protein
MLEECPTIVRWDAGSLCVLNPAALQQTVLPRYFRTARKCSTVLTTSLYMSVT